ncbi:hypothetical protein [Parageobacillus toebii]|uniref:ABC transporter substrate-binding protein n=1 Tax=Parageobacillus toebii TaxID=153151 RepID=A0A150N7G2_9BACL|nr:hypothetical protein [Parageobacillus toebii]KYD32542.1 hypothetical protein B4110_3613 [Parageobacillus toebii]
MRKLAVMFLSIFVFLSACSNTEQPKEQESLLKQSWKDIEAEAKNTTVRMFMWGGDDGINRYMDEWVAPRLKKEYGITFERVPMDTSDGYK